MSKCADCLRAENIIPVYRFPNGSRRECFYSLIEAALAKGNHFHWR